MNNINNNQNVQFVYDDNDNTQRSILDQSTTESLNIAGFNNHTSSLPDDLMPIEESKFAWLQSSVGRLIVGGVSVLLLSIGVISLLTPDNTQGQLSSNSNVNTSNTPSFFSANILGGGEGVDDSFGDINNMEGSNDFNLNNAGDDNFGNIDDMRGSDDFDLGGTSNADDFDIFAGSGSGDNDDGLFNAAGLSDDPFLDSNLLGTTGNDNDDGLFNVPSGSSGTNIPNTNNVVQGLPSSNNLAFGQASVNQGLGLTTNTSPETMMSGGVKGDTGPAVWIALIPCLLYGIVYKFRTR